MIFVGHGKAPLYTRAIAWQIKKYVCMIFLKKKGREKQPGGAPMHLWGARAPQKSPAPRSYSPCCIGHMISS